MEKISIRNVKRKEGQKAVKEVLVGNIEVTEGQDVQEVGNTIPQMVEEKFRPYLGDTFVSAGYIFKALVNMQEAIDNNQELKAIEEDLNREKETLKTLTQNKEALLSQELLDEQAEIEDRDDNFDKQDESTKEAWLKIADKEDFSKANKDIADHCSY